MKILIPTFTISLMPRLIELLYNLQELEQAIDTQERAISVAKAKLGESPQLVRAREGLTSAHEHLAQLRLRRERAEWQVADLEAKIKDINARLYSGRVTNPKELMNLNTELAGLRRQKDQAETEALELIEETEQATHTLRDAERNYAEVEKLWQAEQADLAHEIATHEKELERLRTERQGLVVQLAPRDLELYESTKKRKGKAVARVEQGTCGGCRISLSWAKLQQARANRPVTCDNCGRLLFME